MIRVLRLERLNVFDLAFIVRAQPRDLVHLTHMGLLDGFAKYCIEHCISRKYMVMIEAPRVRCWDLPKESQRIMRHRGLLCKVRAMMR